MDLPIFSFDFPSYKHPFIDGSSHIFLWFSQLQTSIHRWIFPYFPMIFPAIKFHSYMDFPVFSYDFQFFPLFREEFTYIKLHPQWWSHFLRPIGMCLPGCLALCACPPFGMMIPKDSHCRVAESPRPAVMESMRTATTRSSPSKQQRRHGDLGLVQQVGSENWVPPLSLSSDFQTKLCVRVSSYSRLHTGRYL